MELRLPFSRPNQCCVFDAPENKSERTRSLFVKKAQHEFPDFFLVFAVDADDGFYDIYFFFLILTEDFTSGNILILVDSKKVCFCSKTIKATKTFRFCSKTIGEKRKIGKERKIHKTSFS